MAAQRKISSVWQYFDEEEKDKVLCVLHMQKLTYIHLDVNLQRERATTSNTLQTSITTFATPANRRCDPNRSEKVTQLITKMTALDLLSPCFVEGKGFHKLMHILGLNTQYHRSHRLNFFPHLCFLITMENFEGLPSF